MSSSMPCSPSSGGPCHLSRIALVLRASGLRSGECGVPTRSRRRGCCEALYQHNTNSCMSLVLQCTTCRHHFFMCDRTSPFEGYAVVASRKCVCLGVWVVVDAQYNTVVVGRI